MNQVTKLADLLLKLTELEDHPAVKKFNLDCQLYDWESFGDAEVNKREFTILEIFRFLLTGHSTVGVKDLAELSDDDYEAVTLVLHSASRYNIPLEESIK
jgi:hypothetical protein